MITSNCYRMLGLPPGASADDIKKSYRRLARENHPDLYPPEERYQKHLAMMRINEAYMTAMASLKDEDTDAKEDLSPSAIAPEKDIDPDNPFAVGEVKEPAYTYYRLGFQFYTDGQAVFHKRFGIKEQNRTRNIFHGRKDLLHLAISALHNFERAYTFFLEVVKKYPDSIWADDAKDKLETLEKFNRQYQKICENLSP